MYNQTCMYTHEPPTHRKWKGKQETPQIGLWTHFSPAHKDSPPWSTGWVVCNPGWPISSAASISLPLVEYFQSYSLSEGEKRTKRTEHFSPHLWNFSIKISKLQSCQGDLDPFGSIQNKGTLLCWAVGLLSVNLLETFQKNCLHFSLMLFVIMWEIFYLHTLWWTLATEIIEHLLATDS